MGYGDEVMASGHAFTEHKRSGKRVQIVDRDGRPRWDPVWEGLPWIAKPNERGDFAQIQNGPQCRPYIRYPFTRQRGQRWTEWRARDHVGAIAFSNDELEFAARHAARLGDFIVIEPTISDKANPNKQWGKWRQLVPLLRPHTVVQMGPPGTRPIDGTIFVKTDTFCLAAALLAEATAAVLPEGGLHHAAGVTGTRAVVLFGGTISPETTGYEHHVNIADHGPGSPCGRWLPCRHCREVWDRLTPEAVADELQRMINAPRSLHVRSCIHAASGAVGQI